MPCAPRYDFLLADDENVVIAKVQDGRLLDEAAVKDRLKNLAVRSACWPTMLRGMRCASEFSAHGLLWPPCSDPPFLRSAVAAVPSVASGLHFWHARSWPSVSSLAHKTDVGRPPRHFNAQRPLPQHAAN